MRPGGNQSNGENHTEAHASRAVVNSAFRATHDKAALTYGGKLYSRQDGADLIKEDERGIWALLARHVEVGQSTWDGYRSWYKQQVIEAAQEGLGVPRPRRSIFALPLLSPYSPPAAMWTAFMMLIDLTYTAFWVPLGVAFCTDTFGDLSARCTKVDLAGGIVYTLNLLLSFQCGCVLAHDYKKTEVRDGLRVARYYVLYGRFWLDALAMVPFVYLIVILGLDVDLSTSSWVGALSLFRLVRLLRLVSISKVVVADAISGRYHDLLSRHVSVMGLYCLMLGYMLAVVTNLEACIMVLIAYLNGFEDSWLASLTWEDFTAVSAPYQWYCAVYWVITTSTTTGYGDFTPRSVAEQVFANLYMILGMVLFGLLVGTIANALTRASASAAQLYRFRKKISAVSGWLEEHHIPEATRKQVQTYFSEVWVNRNEASLDSEIFSDLPSFLRARVAQYITTDLVIQLPVLRDQELGLQSLVAAALRPVDVNPGHDVCRQGEEGDRLWICADGDLLALQHEAEPQYLPVPCMFGESLLLGDEMPAFRLRPWTVRALGIVKLWELRLNDLWPIMRMYPGFRADLLEHVRTRLLSELGWGVEASNALADDGWCESVASIAQALLKQSAAVVEQAVGELRGAQIEDGGLQALLDGLMEFSSVKTKRITLLSQNLAGAAGGGAGVGAGLQPMSCGAKMDSGGGDAAGSGAPGTAGPIGAVSMPLVLHSRPIAAPGTEGAQPLSTSPGGAGSGMLVTQPSLPRSSSLRRSGSRDMVCGAPLGAPRLSNPSGALGELLLASGVVLPGAGGQGGQGGQVPLVTHACPTCGRHVCDACGQVVSHTGCQQQSIQPQTLPALPGPAHPDAAQQQQPQQQSVLGGGLMLVSTVPAPVGGAGGSGASSALLRSMGLHASRPAGAWRPMGRTSVRMVARGQQGLSAMSVVASGGGQNLALSSIPVENFGEGYGMWG